MSQDAMPSPLSEPLPGGPQGASGAFRILLVDDDVDVVNCIRDFLEEVPGAFEVVSAHSGDEAFLRLVGFEPDVIVLDVGLPDVNGLELLNPIQDIHPSANIVMLTGRASPELRETALRQGAVRFLEKPLELLGFRRLLQELGSKSRNREVSGLEGGMDIMDLVQMMFLCQKSAAVRFCVDRRRATLRFDRGELIYVDDGSLTGEKAFHNMVLLWGEGRFYTIPEETAALLERNCWTPVGRLLMQGAMLRDHTSDDDSPAAEPILDSAQPAPEPPGLAPQRMVAQTRVQELLGQLLDLEGSQAAVLMGWDGVVIEGRVRAGPLALENIGVVIAANLDATQALGRELRVGAGSLVVLEFEQGNLLARVLGSRAILAVLVGLDANLGQHRQYLLKVAMEIEAAL